MLFLTTLCLLLLSMIFLVNPRMSPTADLLLWAQAFFLIFTFSCFLLFTLELLAKGDTLKPEKWGCASAATLVSYIAVPAQ